MKKRYFSKHEKGFSMVELLVVLPLVGIMALFLTYIGIFHFQTYNTQYVELNITNDARIALDDMDNYIRQAHRVASSYLTYTTSGSTLVLQIPSIDGSSQVISGTYDNVVFYLSGTDLFRQVFVDTASSRSNSIKKLASGISSGNLSFTYDNGDYSLVKQVTTTITITQSAGTQIKSINISSKSKLRNY